MSEGRSPAGIETVLEDPRWSELAIDWPDLAASAYDAVMRQAAEPQGGAVALLLCDDETMRKLNAAWRGKDAPTNVLSFPAPPGAGTLGDIALAYDTLARESAVSGKPFSDHAAHLMVHGLLHLLGYDHQTESDSERMEALETRILAGLGVPDPYQEIQE